MKKILTIATVAILATFNLAYADYGHKQHNYIAVINIGGCGHYCSGHVRYEYRRVYDGCRYITIRVRRTYYCPPPRPRPRPYCW